MKTALVVAAAAAGVSAGVLTDSQHQYLFTSFVATHAKQYETKDFFAKFGTFKNNLEAIVAHNANPSATFTMGVNQFADFSGAEFAAMHKFKPKFAGLHEMAANASASKFTNVAAPSSVDWTAKQVNGVNVVGPVQDQASCGSCWAFSTAGTVEAVAVLAGRGFNKLSEQELVDCAGGKYDNEGCNGGLMSSAYDYYRDNGAVSLKDYPYTARDGSCKTSGLKKVYEAAEFTGYTVVPKGADAMKAAIAQAPVAIALAASDMAFQFYKSGVITSGCGTQVNHALVATGYDTFSVNGKDVEGFVIRNSWGASWGDKGYVRVGLDQCGMVSHTWNISPTVKTA